MDNILYIDDDNLNLNLLKYTFKNNYVVFTTSSTEEAITILQGNEIKVVITDQRMPQENGIDFIERISPEFPNVVFMILSGYADFEIARKSIENGRIYKFLLKPWKKDELTIDLKYAIERYDYLKTNKDLIKDLENQNKELTLLKQQLEEENHYLKEEIRHAKNFENIISEDKEFLNILRGIENVANSDAPVLIEGETGTGKELIARAIHNLSPRRHAPFISVNCAAIPETLFESELFGHEKGAFTGAINQRKGKFELANGGTLFLDEIGEIPFQLQSKLLRAIQERIIEKIGSSKHIKLDIRIIAATNRNLLNEIETNNFRSDLYYRLSVIPIKIPPLRDRKNDIPILVNYFIKKFNRNYGKQINSIPKKSLDILKFYEWPGNIRELENIIERAVITTHSDKLIVENFLPDSNKSNSFEKLVDVEKAHIRKILDQTNWKIGGQYGAAEVLGLKRTTLIEKLKKLDISKPN